MICFFFLDKLNIFYFHDFSQLIFFSDRAYTISYGPRTNHQISVLIIYETLINPNKPDPLSRPLLNAHIIKRSPRSARLNPIQCHLGSFRHQSRPLSLQAQNGTRGCPKAPCLFSLSSSFGSFWFLFYIFKKKQP